MKDFQTSRDTREARSQHIPVGGSPNPSSSKWPRFIKLGHEGSLRNP